MINLLLVLLGILFLGLCLFTIVIILLQPGRSAGGGAAGLGATSSIGAAGAIAETLGATQAEKTLSKWTAVCVGLFFVLSLSLTLLLSAREQQGRLVLPGGTAAPAGPVAPGAGAAPGPTQPITIPGTDSPIQIEIPATDQGVTPEAPAQP